VDELGPETRGAIGDGPAATVAMSRATWAAIVVRVCGRCGVVGGLVRDVGDSNCDVGGPSSVVGGSDRSGVAGTAAWAAGTAAWAAGWWILCFGDGFPFPSAGSEANGDRTDGAMEQRSAANLEHSVPAAVDGLESGFRVFESSTWRLIESTSSPLAYKKSKPRMGLYTAASTKVTKKVSSPNDRRRRMVPHVGIDLPLAPDSCGPAGCALEQCGRTLHSAPVSTMNCCLLSSSCKKIMPPPRVFSSRRLIRFPGPTGTRACTSSHGCRRYSGSTKCRRPPYTGQGSPCGCAPGGMASGGVCRRASSPGGGRRTRR
jgi:hypothetical protein